MKGTLKVQLDDHVEVLSEGDSIFYDSGHGHGMIATGGADCTFLAFVMKPHEEKE
jgi:quercetin dioxygenase-like cupin family protein